jgi:hypothetical protein
VTDPLDDFRDLFGAPRALLGMLHAGALPGTVHARDPLDAIIETAVAEARAYRDAGFTALLLENMHDRPYLNGAVGPEIVAAMTAVAREVRRAVLVRRGEGNGHAQRAARRAHGARDPRGARRRCGARDQHEERAHGDEHGEGARGGQGGAGGVVAAVERAVVKEVAEKVLPEGVSPGTAVPPGAAGVTPHGREGERDEARHRPPAHRAERSCVHPRQGQSREGASLRAASLGASLGASGTSCGIPHVLPSHGPP